MVLSIFTYSAVNTKIRSMYGKLLSKADYEEMTSKKTVKDVAAYLKSHTGYGNLLASIDENMVHRGELEKLLNTSLQEDFYRLIRFVRGSSRAFLEAFFLRYEVENLKMILRILNTGHSEGLLEDSLVFLRKYSDIDAEKLVRSRDVAEFVENLKGSDYYKVLAPLIVHQHNQTLFDMEMALDLHFFSSTLKVKDKLLTGKDRDSISESFGIEIDILNIMWIYRCKKLFNLPKETILSKVIPHWYNLSRKQLLTLAGSSTVEEFKVYISCTKYRDIFKSDDEHMWEANYMNFVYKLHKNHLLRGNFNFGQVVAYLHLKEIDIRNIITVIEGIRYSLTKEEIRSYITGYSYLR